MTFMLRLHPANVARWNFILAGQSNMSGRGLLTELPTFPLAYKVKNYANDGTWKDAAEPIDSDAGQIDSVSADSTAAASPSLSFGNELARLRPYNEIGLIPCAKGSTSITDWQKSGLSRSTLYGSMVARALEAAETGPVKGLFWYQGESDANNSSNASNWAALFLAMVADLKADIGVPDLKILVTKLHPDPGTWGAHWATVQAQQDSLDGALDGDVAVVDASDLAVKPGDAVHISTASAVTLGMRAASAMQGLIG